MHFRSIQCFVTNLVVSRWQVVSIGIVITESRDDSLVRDFIRYQLGDIVEHRGDGQILVRQTDFRVVSYAEIVLDKVATHYHSIILICTLSCLV